jgi:DNA-binding MarR family transcriptional regulator
MLIPNRRQFGTQWASIERESMQKNQLGDVSVREIVDDIINLVTTFERAGCTPEKLMKRHIDEIDGTDISVLRKNALSLSEYHVLHYIGIGEGASNGEAENLRSALANGTRLSKSMGMTKGGISKLTAKLQKKGLIRTERFSDNQKEVYYRLTPEGEKIFHLHAKLHAIADKNLMTALKEYDTDQLVLIREFLLKITKAIHIFSESETVSKKSRNRPA